MQHEPDQNHQHHDNADDSHQRRAKPHSIPRLVARQPGHDLRVILTALRTPAPRRPPERRDSTNAPDAPLRDDDAQCDFDQDATQRGEPASGGELAAEQGVGFVLVRGGVRLAQGGPEDGDGDAPDDADAGGEEADGVGDGEGGWVWCRRWQARDAVEFFGGDGTMARRCG